MRGTRVKGLRRAALSEYMLLPVKRRNVQTFKNYFRRVKELYNA